MSHAPVRKRAFTLIELLVVIAIIALLIGILLPALSAARTAARKAVNSTQLRGIQQGMVTFADGNKGYFPGMTSDGKLAGVPAEWGLPTGSIPPVDQPRIADGDDYEGHSATAATVSGSFGTTRMAIMLNDQLVTPEYLISPQDDEATPASPGSDLESDGRPVGQINTSANAGPRVPNMSYASQLLPVMFPIALVTPTELTLARRDEWQATFNPQAVVLADRVLGPTATAGAAGGDYSLWTQDPGPGEDDWQGTVVRNDNSTTFETSRILENSRYGSIATKTDDMFDDADADEDGVRGAAYLRWE